MRSQPRKLRGIWQDPLLEEITGEIVLYKINMVDNFTPFAILDLDIHFQNKK